MIIKQIPFYRSNTKSGTFFEPINYVNKGISDENDLAIFRNISTGFDQQSIIDSFEQNNAFKGSRMQTDAQHIVLSFNELDKANITHEILVDLTDKFLEIRGYDDCVVWGRVHYAKNIHLHLICSQNYYSSSKSCNIGSKKRYMEQNRALEIYQKTHYEKELSNSLVYINHKEKERKPLKKTARSTTKNKVIDLINTLEPKARSLSHLTQLIEASGDGVTPYGRGKNPYHGLKSGGFKFRLDSLLRPERLEVLKRLEQLQEIQQRNDYRDAPFLTR